MIKNCIDCFNEDNEIVDAKFVVITRQSRNYQYFCRAHMARWIDVFINTEIYGFIAYEIKRLRKEI